ncbi:cyclophilin-like fold protein [Methanocorpusculum sp. MG]|uniref:Cyclophilin-like fold protein n=1 Tax=Methanocorpusculum petauri TaxID=3002863 RepID=A0ABT4IEC8_9EURY|nr:cyclophilin-like fold protein [Methanocorpusculum petauri]MCZ0860091.1 cyclophilin-like fold protein [Methanocorpusculum petauri]MDE2443283.1 cyclophilin-like fold protein [Methanocorpusculum sp.]
MKGIFVLLLAVAVLFPASAGCVSPEQTDVPTAETTNSAEPETLTPEENSSSRIRMSFDGHEVIAELYENPAAEDLRSMLPLTLTFRDYNGTEKIAYPPRTLDTTDAPAGYDPAEGDIMLYAPWGNIAIFYHDSPYASGLVPLGHITSGLENLAAMGGEFSVTITVVE